MTVAFQSQCTQYMAGAGKHEHYLTTLSAAELLSSRSRTPFACTRQLRAIQRQGVCEYRYAPGHESMHHLCGYRACHSP